jgi:hypothetical protein
MAAVAGRGTHGRAVAGVVTTDTVATVTAPAASFQEEDAGRLITGTGIPAAATVLSVESDTAATLSAAATASGTVTATLGAGDAAAYGFIGWSPETDAESETYTIAGGASAASPDRITAPNVGVVQRSRA